MLPSVYPMLRVEPTLVVAMADGLARLGAAMGVKLRLARPVGPLPPQAGRATALPSPARGSMGTEPSSWTN